MKKTIITESLAAEMLKRVLKDEEITSLLVEVGKKYKSTSPNIQARREVLDFYEYEDGVIFIIFKFYHKNTPNEFRYGALSADDFAQGTVEDTDENITPDNQTIQ